MKLTRHKSLIREISPGNFIIGSNVFDPAFEINSGSGIANLNGEKILVESALTNISGSSIEYDSAEFSTKPTVLGVPVMLSGEAGASNAESLAKKWAIILG